MSSHSELDEVLLFLAQFDLPAPFGDEPAICTPTEGLPSPIAWPSVNYAVDDLFNPQALVIPEPDREVSMSNEADDDTTNQSTTCSLISPDSVLTSPTQNVSKTSRKYPRPRTYRKQEINSLRGEVHELNGEVQRLLQQWQHDNHPGRLVLRQRSTWHEIASRQRERRKTAERENVNLRKILQFQVHEARNLRRVLKRRTKIELMECLFGMKRHCLANVSVPEYNPQEFDEMLQDMDGIYVGVDSFLLEQGLYELPVPGRRREVQRNSTNGQFFALAQRHALPFDLHTTEKATWNVMRQILFQGLTQVEKLAPHVQFHGHHVEVANNTMKTSFHIETDKLGDVKYVLFRTVVRKYKEKDHSVFICKHWLEPIVHKKGRTSGFITRTILRLVIRSDDSESQRFDQLSCIDSHFSASRYDEGLPVSNILRTPANLDVGIALWDEAISRIVHEVESVAIDESCTNINPVAPS
ncbi:hypothetical protein PHMEG_00021752 [Phytophthora megakarya]|uniref:M96 mating-specific protein n=1 Tax=Phytophthora megakarya TaxID=4795 RepID=A0A225VKF4_9STRA|nr:hypothetical protein PHMEG_00021752 [Phytophthora megakarya]